METRNNKGRKNPLESLSNVHVKMPEIKVNSEALKSLVPYIAMLLCVVVCIGCVVSISGLRKSVNNLSDTVTKEIAGLRAANEEMMDRISVVESAIHQTTSAVNENNSSKYITITKQPETVSTTLGRDEALVFSVKATGSAISFADSFTWQKYDTATGNWVNVPFDSNGFCTAYGLRLYNYFEKEDNSVNVSCIYAKGITAEGFGSYRCVISDSAGSKVVSDQVNLSQKAA